MSKSAITAHLPGKLFSKHFKSRPEKLCIEIDKHFEPGTQICIFPKNCAPLQMIAGRVESCVIIDYIGGNVHLYELILSRLKYKEISNIKVKGGTK